jgi:dephospho-CoA kinase
MLSVGITGGIGSGKSTVCQVFETLGIPVLYADNIAKQLMENDDSLKVAISNLLGAEAYTGKQLNKTYIANIVFHDKNKLAQLNAITHPAVIAYGEDWMKCQKTAYVLKEAALFFESGSNKNMDVMIGVSAPLHLRIERTMHRDAISKEDVMVRISKQMDDAAKMKLCDYVIINDEKTSIIDQVIAIHNKLVQRNK